MYEGEVTERRRRRKEGEGGAQGVANGGTHCIPLAPLSSTLLSSSPPSVSLLVVLSFLGGVDRAGFLIRQGEVI